MEEISSHGTRISRNAIAKLELATAFAPADPSWPLMLNGMFGVIQDQDLETTIRGGPEPVVTLRLDLKSRHAVDVPRGTGGLRLKLHRRAHKLATIELPAMPDASWPAVLDHAIDHEALAERIPRYVRRYAWRDRRLARRLLRIG